MNPEPHGRWGLRPILLIGYLALFTLVFGLGAWAAATRISGAVVASGTLEVEGNRQVVQHPIGGVIAEIHARDGDRIKSGDVLIVLDGEALISELGIVEGQWLEILARKSRLSAERDGHEAIGFDPELLARAGAVPEIAALIAAQTEQFAARRKMLAEEDSQLGERQIQIADQIAGLEALRTANRTEIDLLSQEIEGQETLLAQGLTQVSRVLTPQRELARLQGTDGQVEANIAESRGRIAEIEIERVRLVSEARSAAITELRDLEFREIELRERQRTLTEQIARLELRAPAAGTVYGSTADTLRGVIRPAEPVLYIVPEDSPLIVRSRIEVIHIDQLHEGQEAVLRFPAFNARTTPEVTGRVIAISADAIEDPQTRLRYYRADIRLDKDALAALEALRLVPGMPVEAFVRTEERSPLSYLVKPLSDYFTRAFRES